MILFFFKEYIACMQRNFKDSLQRNKHGLLGHVTHTQP